MYGGSCRRENITRDNNITISNIYHMKPMPAIIFG